MFHRPFVPALALFCLIARPAAISAADTAPASAAGESNASEEPKHKGGIQKLRDAVMKHLDKDHDGKISEEEKKTITDGLQKKLTERYDTNKDGKLDAEEKTKAREQVEKIFKNDGGSDDAKLRQQLVKKFDKNGDGKLDEIEKKAALKSMDDGNAAATIKDAAAGLKEKKTAGKSANTPAPSSAPPAAKAN